MSNTRRPQLPTSGEVLGSALGALRLRSLLSRQVPDRTLRRVLGDEPGVKEENRRELLEAAVAELLPDELLQAWGVVPSKDPAEPAANLRAQLMAMAEMWLSDWDNASGTLRSTDIGVPGDLFAVLPWVRMLAIELGLRVGAYFAFVGIKAIAEDETLAIVEGRAFDRLVRKYRERAGGISREDLARGGGVSESTVDEWLAGRALPQAESVLSLAAVIASRVEDSTEAEITFHLRCAVAASSAARWLWDVCPNDPPPGFGPGPPRPAQFVIEFLAILEIAHTLLLKPPVARSEHRPFCWIGMVRGSLGLPGKGVLQAALEQARDSYLRADLNGVINERWHERALLLYRQLPTVEGAGQDPDARRLGLDGEVLAMVVEMEAWGRVSPNPDGWYHKVPHSDMGRSTGEDSEFIVMNTTAMLTPAQRASRQAVDAQHARGDDAERLANYQRLVKMEPKNEMAHFWLGAALAAVGRIEEAIIECHIAAGLKPDWSLPAVEVAIILSNAGRSPEALAVMRGLNGKYEVDAHFANVHGYTLMYERHFNEAVDWFRRALKLNPKHARATMHLAHCLLMIGQSAQGRRLAKQARHWGEPGVYYALKAGEYDKRRK